MTSRCLALTENYTPLPKFFSVGFRGRRVAALSGLPAARSTADPASAAKSEQVSSLFSIFFLPQKNFFCAFFANVSSACGC
jgi:hypothetical protein